MKHVRLFSLCVVLLLSNLALTGNYILVIDGKEYEVDLDEKSSIQLADGKAINVTLKKKAIVNFKTGLYSFDHPSDVTPTRQDLGEGIHQMMLTTAQGSAVIVQDYTTMDPTPLVDMMLNELTKEEKQYGYKFLDTPYKKKLTDGSEVAGKQSISSLQGQQVTRRVVTIGGKDKGLLIITMLDKAAPEADKKMIDTFWESLKPDLK